MALQKRRQLLPVKQLGYCGTALLTGRGKADSRAARRYACLPVSMKEHGIPIGVDELWPTDNKIVCYWLPAVRAGEHSADQVRYSASLPCCLNLYGMRYAWLKKHRHFYLVRHRQELVSIVSIVSIVSVMSASYNFLEWRVAKATKLWYK
jgi:hypothetical protein